MDRIYKTIIVDNDKYCIQILQTLIEEHFPHLKIESTFTDPTKAGATKDEPQKLDIQLKK